MKGLQKAGILLKLPIINILMPNLEASESLSSETNRNCQAHNLKTVYKALNAHAQVGVTFAKVCAQWMVSKKPHAFQFRILALHI